MEKDRNPGVSRVTLTLQYVTDSPADVRAYMAIEKSSASRFNFAAKNEQEAAKEICESEAFFIVKDGTKVGILAYEIRNRMHVYISRVAVKKQYESQRLDRAALCIVLRKYRNMRRVDLVTHPEDNQALRTYLALGFVLKKWLNDYRNDGEPRVRLEWEHREFVPYA